MESLGNAKGVTAGGTILNVERDSKTSGSHWKIELRCVLVTCPLLSFT
jgi:hypothetical protein